MSLLTVTKVVSGGQVGAERGALDFAIKHDIPHGGWCPKNRLALDGCVPFRYLLQESSSTVRRHLVSINVRDSDATAVFTTHPPGLGSDMAILACFNTGKPCAVITLAPLDEAAQHLLEFIRHHKVKTLNATGSRQPEFYQFTQRVLQTALQACSPKTSEALSA